MRILLLLSLLVGCSDNHISDEELLKKAEDFCSCHQGVWYVGRVGTSDIVEIKCNNGTHSAFNEFTLVKRVCE
jgi:hypothetical protein